MTNRIRQLLLMGYAIVFRPSVRALRPRSVTVGVALGALGWGVPIGQYVLFTYIWSFFGLFAIPGPAYLPRIVIGGFIWLVFLIWLLVPLILLCLMLQGRNWAKWFFISYSVFCRQSYFWSTYDTLKTHHAWADLRKAFFDGDSFSALVQAILLTASIVLVSLPAASRWFRSEVEPPPRYQSAPSLMR